MNLELNCMIVRYIYSTSETFTVSAIIVNKLLFLLSVPGLGLAQAMPFSIIRGESSRLLGSEYQGMFTLGLFTILSVKL